MGEAKEPVNGASLGAIPQTMVEAKVGVVPNALYKCPGCREVRMCLDPNVVTTLNAGHPVPMTCGCGQRFKIKTKKNLIHRVTPNVGMNRAQQRAMSKATKIIKP